MTNIEESVIARLKKSGQNFEILVDCDKALIFKEGKLSNLDEVLVTDEIFSDVKKGMRASEHEMEKIFGTADKREIAKEIIMHGEIQLTAEHRARKQQELKKRIIDIIHRNTIDAKTGLPHPIQRIENAMEEAKINIDVFKSAEEQVQDIIKQLRPILPIKFETREYEIKVPVKYLGNVYHLLKNYGKVLKEEYASNGDLIAVLEVPAGITQDMFDELNKLTHGEIESKLLASK